MSGDVEDKDSDVSGCPSLQMKVSCRDLDSDNSSLHLKQVTRMWRWGDDLSSECGDNLILSDGEDWVPWNQDERKVQVETIQLASEAKEDEYKDQSSMMKVGIKFVEENAIKAYKKVQGGELALPVVNGDAIDGEMELEACVNMPKVKRFNVGSKDMIQKNTWIADSDALTHIGNSDAGMTNVCVIDLPVQIRIGKTL
jgi:hypothetical protein